MRVLPILLLSSSPSLCSVRVVFGTQSTQCERAERKAKVSERDVEVAWDHEQISDDQKQPCRYDVGEDAWFKEDSESRYDLDHADDEHQLVAVTTRERVNRAGKVLIPVHEEVKKLIEAGEDGRRGESEAQNLISLVARPRRSHAPRVD